jgi:tetratricopeptide (TPR) repeat protein
MSRKVPLLVLIAAILLSCASKEPAVLKSFEKATLSGMVYDYDNRPCSGVAVTLDDEWTVAADINGRFVFTAVGAGEHKLEFAKEGYEMLLLPFEFVSRTQVVYAKIASLDQLIRRIETAISEKNWREAQEDLARASAIEEQNPIVRYLRSVLLLEKGDVDQAVAILVRIIESGKADPVVYLSLADIYQHRLLDIRSAMRYLDGFLELRGDPEVQERYDELKRRIR